MIKHSLFRTGLGVGIMAASLGAGAASLQTYAEPMAFYKTSGSAVNYTAFMPSMLGPGVLMLELYQSGTVSSWAYAMGATVDAAAEGGDAYGWKYSRGTSISTFSATATDATSGGSYTVPYNDAFTLYSLNALGSSTALGYTSGTGTAAITVTSTGSASGTVSVSNPGLLGASQAVSSTWYGGVTSGLTLSMTQSYTASSQACVLNFDAVLNSEGNLLYSNMSFQPSGGGYITESRTGGVVVTYNSTTGAAGTTTTTVGSAAWNAQSTTLSSIGSSASFGVSNAAGSTALAYSVVSKINAACLSGITAKQALNSAGSLIGGKAGMQRLW